MSRLMEPLQRHIHSELTSEVNEMIIALKLNSSEVYDNSTEEQRKKIDEARGRHKMPTTPELIDLLSRVRDEMDKCREPYRRY